MMSQIHILHYMDKPNTCNLPGQGIKEIYTNTQIINRQEIFLTSLREPKIPIIINNHLS